MRLTYLAEAVFKALLHNRTGEDKFVAKIIWRDENGSTARTQYADVTDIFTAGECAILIDMTNARDTRDGQ